MQADAKAKKAAEEANDPSLFKATDPALVEARCVAQAEERCTVSCFHPEKQ